MQPQLRSRISVDIDLDKDGKYVGFARVPHSVHRSAYGWIPVPICSIKNGPGKTIVLLGGTHGDEYEAQVALSNLARSLMSQDIRGQVIIVPMANFPAARAGTRVSPIDGGNLARLFPGDPSGTVSQMIAHFLETELIARADLLFDLHSGGSSLNYLPCTTSLSAPGTSASAGLQPYMQLFGAPYALNFHGKSGMGGTADAAERRGVLRIGCELGGRAWLDRRHRELCESGVRRILRSEGVLFDSREEPAAQVEFFTVTAECYVWAIANGLFEAAARLGDLVTKGDLAGLIHDPGRPLAEPTPVYFGASGLVVCERPSSMCEVGDCLLHLALST